MIHAYKKKQEKVAIDESTKISSTKRREIAIYCIITAWNRVVCYKSTVDAFRKTEMNPFNVAIDVNTIT